MAEMKQFCDDCGGEVQSEKQNLCYKCWSEDIERCFPMKKTNNEEKIAWILIWFFIILMVAGFINDIVNK